MRTFIHVIVSLSLVALFGADAARAQEHTEPREATISTDGAGEIEIRARAGSLRITGRSGLSEVRVRGTARASEEDVLQEIQIETHRDGDAVVVEAVMPDAGWFGGLLGGSGDARLDLVIEVPASLPLDVEDSSGDTEIAGTAALDLDDSSGDVTLRGIDGPVDLDDSSGDIEIEDVRGDVEIDDSSGDLVARDVEGRLSIDDSSGGIRLARVGAAAIDDSSGNIDVQQVRGDVRIGDDSSGNIRVTDAQGSVHVEEDSSGNITVRGVGGDFVVEDDGSGDISYEQVAGNVRIPEE